MITAIIFLLLFFTFFRLLTLSLLIMTNAHLVTKMSGTTLQLATQGASKALLKSVNKVLGSLSIATTSVSMPSSNTVVIGNPSPQGVHTAVVDPAFIPRIHPAYTSIKTTVVRSILPRRPLQAIQLRDLLDIYPSSGIDITAEREEASTAFGNAANIAVEKARRVGASSITVVIKPATKYLRLNDLFTKTVSEVIQNEGITFDVIHTSRAANELLLFPEKFDVVLTNDDPICENVQMAFAGILGGCPVSFYTMDGHEVHGGNSLKSVALAAAKTLKAQGMVNEAEQLENHC